MATIDRSRFAQLGRDSFERRLIDLLRADYPAQVGASTDAALAQDIWAQVQRASGYGLADEQSAAIFVVTAFLLGPGFDERIPALRQVLRASELSAASNAQALADFTQAVFAELDKAGAR